MQVKLNIKLCNINENFQKVFTATKFSEHISTETWNIIASYSRVHILKFTSPYANIKISKFVTNTAVI